MAVKSTVKSNGKAKNMSGEVYCPSDSVVAQARLKDWEAVAEATRRDPQAFWAKEAEELEWYQKWDKVLDDSKKPFYKWFVGGKTNIVHNAIDRHLKTCRKNKLALIWEGEDGKLHQTFSYYALNREVSRIANVLKAMGVQQRRPGDHLHGPRARDRLCHAGLRQDRRGPFGGLRRLLASRRCTAGSRTANRRSSSPATAAYMNGKIVELKKIVDEALKRCPTRRARDRRQAHRPRGAHGGRPRPLVPRPDGACPSPTASARPR